MTTNHPDIAFLGLNSIGETVYDWICDRDDCSVVTLLTNKEQLETLHQLSPDLIISAGFRHILPSEILDIPELGCINLHKSFLPTNRGANMNVWSIIEDNPAGVSIHYMTEEIDEGPVIDRRRVSVYPDDTGKTLYQRLETAQFEQFKQNWPAIRDGEANPTPQAEFPEEPTHHYKQDFVDLYELDLDEEERIGDLLDRLRSLTFPPYNNAYFEKEGDKYYVEVDITPTSEVDDKQPDDEAYSSDEKQDDEDTKSEHAYGGLYQAE